MRPNLRAIPLTAASGIPSGRPCAPVRRFWQAAPTKWRRPLPVATTSCRANSQARHFASQGRPELPEKAKGNKEATAGNGSPPPAPPSPLQNPQPPRGQGKSAPTSRAPFLVLAALAAAGAASYCYAFGQEPSAAARSRPLNQDTFVPFTVVARDTVSPTAFVLTLRLDGPGSHGTHGVRETTTREAVARAWRHGLWSVEVRQPQLQIARDYTPLPRVVVHDDEDDDDDDGTTIRLFVRTVPGGEMSRYLSQRTVGDSVDLRGPRLGFNVVKRLGGGAAAAAAQDGDEPPRRVVFVAAGTGMAPALQAASAALARATTTDTHVTILWANRLRADSAGLGGRSTGGTEDNAVVRDLKRLQQRFGPERLRVQCFADEDATLIREADLKASLGLASRSWWRAWLSSDKEEPAVSPLPARPPSFYESNKILENLDADPDEEAAPGSVPASSSLGGGKNLVIVSGPDGFVSLVAGRKQWAQGKERQGPIGGMLGSLQARYPSLRRDWQVLKL